MSVIKHDFGLKQRRTVDRFRKRLNLDALHEDNIRANPLPYLERASERIYQLERGLFEAALAAKPPSGEQEAPVIVEVDKAEYNRLLNCKSIVESAIARLEPDKNDV